MDVSEALDKLRNAIAGCDFVAYADLSSKMVLAVSSATRHAQEDVDRLSANAVTMLDGSVAEGGLPIVGEDDKAVHVAMALDASAASLYLRAEGGGTEALICICAPSTDLASAITQGAKTLQDMANVS